jgi:hypothetical protein
MTEKPLGRITAILADLGLEVTYAYDDLVFVQHSAFLLQFTEEHNALKLFINQECNPAEANNVASNMVLEFDQAGFSVTPTGRYALSQDTGTTLAVRFI